MRVCHLSDNNGSVPTRACCGLRILPVPRSRLFSQSTTRQQNRNLNTSTRVTRCPIDSTASVQVPVPSCWLGAERLIDHLSDQLRTVCVHLNPFFNIIISSCGGWIGPGFVPVSVADHLARFSSMSAGLVSVISRYSFRSYRKWRHPWTPPTGALRGRGTIADAQSGAPSEGTCTRACHC
jgi:hypothetical protein